MTLINVSNSQLPRGHHRYIFISSISCCNLLFIPIDSVQWPRVRRPAWCPSLDKKYRIEYRAPADESGVKTRTVESDFNFDPSQVEEFYTDDQIATKARTFRQDLGKVSIKYFLFYAFISSQRTLFEVFILNGKYESDDQTESVATTYMNRFGITEDDQFEIHVKRCPHHYFISEECTYNAAEEVMLRAQQGLLLFINVGVN